MELPTPATIEPTIVVHGGAWAIPDMLAGRSRAGVRAAATRGLRLLQTGGSAVDAVEAAVSLLEDDDAFDAGTGSVLTSSGEVEMDSVIMDGQHLALGAVACVQNIKNPVCLARMVMEKAAEAMQMTRWEQCPLPAMERPSRRSAWLTAS